MANKPYNVLMFGNLGPEVIRMSDLFNPSKGVFEYEASGSFQTNRTYYTAEIKNNTIRFFEMDPQPTAGTSTGGGNYWFVDDNSRFDKDQTGHYIPAPTSLVIVDPEASESQLSRWGKYTLLVVDSVDPVTYAPTLVPFNFSGDLDSAERAIDFQNDRMMLYFDSIDNGAGDTVIRLTPDRKLLMYGSSSLKYLIKKGGRVVSTRSFPPTEAATLATYLPATSTKIDFTSYSSVNDEGFAEKYSQIKDQYAEYYDVDGVRCRTTITDSNKSLVLGKMIYILGVTNSPLNNVLVPDACYLRESSDVSEPVEGELYTFEVYEEERLPNKIAHNLVLSVQLTATSGSRTVDIRPTDGEITGFDVQYLNEDTGKYTDTSDIIEVPAGTTEEEICRKLNPYLRKADGREYIDPNKELLNRSWYVYGLEGLTQDMPVGYALSILIRYFPSKNQTSNSLNTLDVRSEPLTEDELVMGPSPLKLYFVKPSDEYELADGNGHPASFVSGTVYYKKRTDTPWSSVVHTPTRDYINCYKKIVIKNVQTSKLRYLVPAPIWRPWVQVPSGNYQPVDQEYYFKILDYNNTYSSPVDMDLGNLKIAAPSYSSGSDNGLRLYGTVYAESAADIPTKQSIRVKYRTTEGGIFEPAVHDISIMLRAPHKETAGVDKWIINVDGNTFGSSMSSSKRPFVIFDHSTSHFLFSNVQFPNKETLLNTFYYSLAGRDAIMPTHLRLRGIEAVEKVTSDGVELVIPVATLGLNGDDKVALDGDTSEVPFLSEFVKTKGMMPELSTYTVQEDINGQTRNVYYAFEKSVSTEQFEVNSEIVRGPRNGVVVGALIVEFLLESNGVFRTLIGVPTEIRIVNFTASNVVGQTT